MTYANIFYSSFTIFWSSFFLLITNLSDWTKQNKVQRTLTPLNQEAACESICSKVPTWCPEVTHTTGIRKWKKETGDFCEETQETLSHKAEVSVVVASTDGPHLRKGVQVQMFPTWGPCSEHPKSFHTCIHANVSVLVCLLKPHRLHSLQPKRLFQVRFLDLIQTCSNVFDAFLWLVLHSLCRFLWNLSGRFWLVLLNRRFFT